jgi:glutathione-regulated potassium-efflux system ancillary protein KefG
VLAGPPVKNRVLVLLAHPALERSRVHARLLESARGVDGATIHDLYELYPDFDIDVGREQALAAEHDVLVFQHPMYWYSAPPLLKQWQDLVLEHGWAYGSRGTALRGRSVMHALSCGGTEAAYQRGGHNRFSIAEFLRPFEQSTVLCNMTWLPPFVVYGTHALDAPRIEACARAYGTLLEQLRDEDLAAVGDANRPDIR